MLLTPKRFVIDCNEYFDGGPDAVVETHSPGDEAYEKLDFYTKVGVLEVWIIDRDTKRPEIFSLVDGAYQVREADADGLHFSGVANVELRSSTPGELQVRTAGKHDTLRRLA